MTPIVHGSKKPPKDYLILSSDSKKPPKRLLKLIIINSRFGKNFAKKLGKQVDVEYF